MTGTYATLGDSNHATLGDNVCSIRVRYPSLKVVPIVGLSGCSILFLAEFLTKGKVTNVVLKELWVVA